MVLTGELKRVEFVGPQVGAELRDQGGLGMLVALFMIFFMWLLDFNISLH